MSTVSNATVNNSSKGSNKVRSFMTYEDLCRQAMHNKVEREVIELELALNDKISFPRSQYLGSGLERLNKEKEFLLRKEERIRKFNNMNYTFII